MIHAVHDFGCFRNALQSAGVWKRAARRTVGYAEETKKWPKKLVKETVILYCDDYKARSSWLWETFSEFSTVCEECDRSDL